MKRLPLCLLAIALAAPSHADPLWCVGQITGVLVSKNGRVQLLTNYASDWRSVCSLTEIWKSVPIELCGSWYAAAVAARTAQTPTTVFYNNGEGYASCAAIPYYDGAPSPDYIMLVP
jgi:hypothetical protein